MSAQDFSRIPVTIIEIDQDLCCLQWKETNECGTCNATGDSPCYNTRATCQSPVDYETGAPLTIRFSMADRSTVDPGEYVMPSMVSVATSPTRINVGGRKDRDKALGRRAQSTITFKDHPHSDFLVDPYYGTRGFDAMDRSTFWPKWLKRNPFHQGRAIRILEGYEGEAIGQMQARHYVIDKIEGPDSSGRVTLTAQDILRLADDDKAQAPRLSNGVLLNPLDESETGSFVVTGGTLAEYTQYGTKAIRISDEVIRYGSVTQLGNGDLQFSTLTRATDGSELQSHDAEDAVQACLEYVQVPPWEVARDLLVDYGNVPSAFIPYADWIAEAEPWLGGVIVTRLLTEPVGVTHLLGELSEQCLFFIWWDELAQEIRLRTVRPSVGVPPLITEGLIIAGSPSIKVRPELRASEVWTNFRPRNFANVEERRTGYRRTRARVDAEASGPNQYGDRRVYEVFSPWLRLDSHVDLLNFRLLARYREPPIYFTFALDVRERGLGVADVFDLEYRAFVDEEGAPEVVRYQVISAHESPPGEKIIYEAQKFDFGADQRFGGWMIADAPSYHDASEEERLLGFFWGDENGLMPNGDDGYSWV